MSRKDKNNQNIQVCLRIRPQNTSDVRNGGVTVVESTSSEVRVREKNQKVPVKTFTFDKVFGTHSKQTDVYNTAVKPIVDEVMKGYNCTLFAYGQTGTGKTFTMSGERSDELAYSWESDPLAGIIPRSMSQLFDCLGSDEDMEFSVRVSYMELYNEELFDLLSPIDDGTKLRIFDDNLRKGSVVINGVEEMVVKDKQEVYGILERGGAKRRTAATLMNAQSSRSHSVFTVTVHMRSLCLDGEEEQLVRIGKLNLVDLAGSENIGRSGSVASRAREAGSINQSLLTLGRVITSLVEHQPHIPYRESKLTRLLQDALGGRSKTTIIATISPSSLNVEETLSTLDYANRAKNIQNRPEVNEKLNKRELIKEYTDEMERLRRDLQAQREKSGIYIDTANYNKLQVTIQQQRERIVDLEARLVTCSEEFRVVSENFELTQRELEILNAAKLAVEQELEKLEYQRESLKQRLSRTEFLRGKEEYLKEMHTDAENQLRDQERGLLQALGSAEGDLLRVHDKLDRLSKLENENKQALSNLDVRLGGSAATLRSTLSDVKENISVRCQKTIQKMNNRRANWERQTALQAEKVASIKVKVTGEISKLKSNLEDKENQKIKWKHRWLEAVGDMESEMQNTVNQFIEETFENSMSPLRESLNVLNVGLSDFCSSVEQQRMNDLKDLDVLESELREDMLGLQSCTQSLLDRHEMTLGELLEEVEKGSQEHCVMLEEKEKEFYNLLQAGFKALSNSEKLRRNSLSTTVKKRVEEKKLDDIALAEKHTTLAGKLSVGVEHRRVNVHENCEAKLCALKTLCTEAETASEKRLGDVQSVVTDFANKEVVESIVEHSENLEAAVSEEDTVKPELLLCDVIVQQVEQESDILTGMVDQLGNDLKEGAVEQLEGVQHVIACADEELVKCSTEVTSLEGQIRNDLLEEVKADQPTGSTPARMTMPTRRPVSMLSPDSRLVQRFKYRYDEQLVLQASQVPLPESVMEDSMEERLEDVKMVRSNGSTNALSIDSGAESMVGLPNGYSVDSKVCNGHGDGER